MSLSLALLEPNQRGTISDFGCQSASWLAALPDALVVVGLFVLLAWLGRLVGGSRRWLAADVISGWGVLAGVVTLIGTLTHIPLAFPVAALGVVAIYSGVSFRKILRLSTSTGLSLLDWGAKFIRNPVSFSLYLIKKQANGIPDKFSFASLSSSPVIQDIGEGKRKFSGMTVLLFFCLISQLWLLPLINLAGITGWDDIAHWTPNAFFLWRHDAFPSAALPSLISAHVDYPYAMPILTYAAALLKGAFIVQGGAMITWLLLTIFALALVKLPHHEHAASLQAKKPTLLKNFAWFALALLLTTLFNPGFNASFTVTGQSDASTAVVVGFLGLLLAQLHRALVDDDETQSTALGAQISAVSVVLILLRQMNVAFLIFLVAGFLALALKDRRFLAGLKIIVLAVIPALLVRWVWKDYLTHESLSGIFTALPLSEWHWDHVPALLRAAGQEILKKSGLFLLLTGASLTGLWLFFKTREKKDDSTLLRTVAFLTAAVFFGNLLFLFLAYVGGGFTLRDIDRAASFYRYTTHIGLLGVATLWLMVRAWLAPRLETPRHWYALALISFLILPLAYLVKPTFLVAQSRESLCVSRHLGQSLAKTLPPHTGLAVIDPAGNGFQSQIFTFEFALDDARRRSDLRVTHAYDEFTNAPVDQLLARLQTETTTGAVYLGSTRTEEQKQALQTAFGLSEPPEKKLLQRTEKGWAVLPILP